jgi:predicted nucleic acid-binding protein
VGLILDSSVAIEAERRGDTVQALLQRVIDLADDQEAALSAVGVVELVHGIHRADTPECRARREEFIESTDQCGVDRALTPGRTQRG